VERRHLLGALGLTAAGVLLPGCGSGPENNPQPEISESQRRMIDEIQALPDSPVKSLLIKRALPYFNQSTPFQAKLGDVTFPVHGSSVTERTTADVTGTFRPRGNKSPSGITLRETVTVPVPLDFMVPTEIERRRFGNNRFSSDQTPFVPITFKQGEEIYQGISPEITISHPVPTTKHTEAQTKFSFIKEACTLAFFDLMTENIVKKMKENNVPTYIKVKGEQIEVVHEAISRIYGNGGRFLALLDIGGYILAFKAYEGTEINKTIQEPKENVGLFAHISAGLAEVNFGSDDLQTLHTVSQWVLAHPETNMLGHVGTISKLP
jgi:hypothetical protein